MAALFVPRSRLLMALWFASLLGAGCAEPAPSIPREAFVEGELIVGYHKDLPREQEVDVRRRHGLGVLRPFSRTRVDHLIIEDGVSVRRKIQALSADPRVLYAEPNYRYGPGAFPADLDPRLWGLHNDGSYGLAGVDINATEAWGISTGSRQVVVAVIDSGLDGQHPDLVNNRWINVAEQGGADGVDDDGNGYVDDVFGWDFVDGDPDPSDPDGHGTHVAGIIGAAGEMGGVVGVNWEVSLMACRFIGPYGGSSADAVDAIEYAVDNGARVINASWGGPGYSQAVRDAIAYAHDHGVLFVTAAGNEGQDVDQMASYPGNYAVPNIVAVAATTSFDELAEFSNYGAVHVDVGAPGQAIYSTFPGGGYEWLDGTSMASPMVAGAAALALSIDETLAGEQLKQQILLAVDPVPDLEGRTVAGGRLDVGVLLAAVDNPSPADPDGPGDGWIFVDAPIDSPHPYADDYAGEALIEHPGAAELRLHFTRLETEPGYDFVHIEDAAGDVVASYCGSLGAFVTDPIPGNTAAIQLLTDYSITAYGMEIEGYSWR